MNPVLNIEIIHLNAGIYEVHCEDQPEPTTHGSISDAIRYYGNEIPSGYSQFANLNYSGVSLGTRYIPHFARNAELLATELVELVNDVHRSIEDMGRMNSSKASAR